MPLINFHAARVRDPNDFIKDTYVTIVLKGVEGIELVNAKLKKDGKGGPLTAQSYRFDKDNFTEKQAKDWLKKHKTKTILFEPAKEEVKEVTMNTSDFDTVWEKVRKKKKTGVIVPVPPASMSSRGMTEQKVVATTIGAGDYGYLFKGSYEELSRNIRDALIKSKEYGDWPSILATFPKRVFVETYMNHNKFGAAVPADSEKRKFFEIEYTLENDEVKIGDVTELEKKTQLFIKEWAEEIAKGLFPLDEVKLFEAKWTTKTINDLPDSSFAYVGKGEKDEEGKTKPRSLRYLPYKDADGKIDLPHLRNALARLPQTDLSDDEKKKALAKLEKAAKEAGVGK